MGNKIDLSIVIPTLNEKDNLIPLIPKLREVISALTNFYEIIVVDGGSKDGTIETASSLGSTTVTQKRKGYSGALKDGFEEAKGTFIITLDADLSHNPEFIKSMWEKRQEAKIIIGSRYIPGGEAKMPASRKILSIILNLCFSKILSLPFKDLSSGFRLYHKHVLEEITIEGTNFEILEEILIKCFTLGYKVIEVPLIYLPRESGRSKAKLLKFGISLSKTLIKMWCLRNSVDSADYNERAYNSLIPLQRYWQRKRHDIITKNIDNNNSLLVIGCGSSQIIRTLDQAVGVDIKINRLRYMRKYQAPLANSSALALPFKKNSFKCVICCQPTEHEAFDMSHLKEVGRVVEAGGSLIINTVDYSKIMWKLIEPLHGLLVPGGNKDKYIGHYTRDKLIEISEKNGFSLISEFYICKAELILKLKKIK